MLNTRILLGAGFAAILAAACSSGGDLSDNAPFGPKAGAGGIKPGPTGSTAADPTKPPPTSTAPDPNQPPPPASGPGSISSPAHAAFVANVFPKLTNCATCHASGAEGAPKTGAGM